MIKPCQLVSTFGASGQDVLESGGPTGVLIHSSAKRIDVALPKVSVGVGGPD